MVNQSNKVLNTNITKLVNKTYQYGFSTNIEKDIIKKGLTEQTVRLISKKKQEPDFLLEFRLKAYRKWKGMSEPEWAYLKSPQINYQDIIYFARSLAFNLLTPRTSNMDCDGHDVSDRPRIYVQCDEVRVAIVCTYHFV